MHLILLWLAFDAVHADVIGVFSVGFAALQVHLDVTFYLQGVYHAVGAFFFGAERSKVAGEKRRWLPSQNGVGGWPTLATA